jgi:mannose-1-phosphate guanylyltransferase
MRYALILAGGSGVRLWPMSRQATPKHLLPFIGGKSLLEIAAARLDSLVPAERCYICAGERHRAAILQALPSSRDRFLGEPVGRDTVNAVGFSAAVIAREDPEAVIGVFTADHLIEPVDEFQKIVSRGYSLAERNPETLVTFGILPSFASTGYGYLELGGALEGGARLVEQPPPRATTRREAIDTSGTAACSCGGRRRCSIAFAAMNPRFTRGSLASRSTGRLRPGRRFWPRSIPRCERSAWIMP